MLIGDRERLLGRIRQIRRSNATREQQARPATEPTEPAGDPIRDLELRVAHLEQLLEGLQDSVHREFQRHDEMIAELQKEIEPGTLGQSLAEDARNRGL
jgi:predicted  nucleic acid-binding Zn-ribbon protein